MGSSRLIVAIGEEEERWLFILEDFLDGVVVERDDLGVDEEDEYDGQDNSLVHRFQIKICIINQYTRLILTPSD